jgi:hypothetical protein
MRKRSSKKKRAHLNELAGDIIKETVSTEAQESSRELGPAPEISSKNPAAVALGRLGGLKGGPARAKKLTKK